MNTQTSRDILREAFDQIHRHVAAYICTTSPHSATVHANEKLKAEHSNQVANLQRSIQ